MTDKEAVKWFNTLHWNEITHHEPPTVKVWVLTEGFKIILAHRKEYTKVKHEPNTYYCVETGKALVGYNTPIKWAYP